MFLMRRNPGHHPMARFGAMAVLALMVGGLTACGGGSGGGGATPPKALDAAKLPGAWISTSNGDTSYLLVQPSNSNSFTGNVLNGASLDMGAFTLNLAGSAVSGTALAYESLVPGAISFPAGKTSGAEAFAGTATANPNTLTLGSPGQSPSSRTAFTSDPAASNPVALADLAGNYEAPAQATSAYRTIRLTVNPPAAGATSLTCTGVFDPGGANLPFTGRISATSFNNQFGVSMTLPSGPGTTAGFTGAAYLRSGSPATLIVMTATDADPASTTAEQASGIFTRQ